VNGSTFSYGDFVNYVISFVILAAVIFFLVVKPLNAMATRRQAGAAPTTKTCEHCASTIPVVARVCAFCTRDVSA
jgi:large conductance mechanosensitive channel